MFWRTNKMYFKRELRDIEKFIMLQIADADLPEYKLLMIEDFLAGRRHMRKYPKGTKKEKKVRPAFSNHNEGC